MRTSIVIAAHNEGEELIRTIESCIAAAMGLDYEIVLVDDASTDGMPALAERRFAPVRLHRRTPRLGASPTKHYGAQQARGDVLIFLDGHVKPEHGALQQLVRAVEETDGQAVITPRIVALDVRRWQNALTQVGHGYAFDLATLDARWVPLDEMQRSPLGGGRFFESAALIGCAFAVSRTVYEKVWGFDPQMKFWGLEDLDFSFKSWSMGHPILHHPEIVVGHRFQAAFTNYSVPWEHILVNKLRLAYKNYTHGVWSAWLDGERLRHGDALAEHPEGLWAHGWELFKAGEDTARQERAYLHAHRQRDEFWYARRFGLPWPRLDGHGAAAAPRLLLGSPSPSHGPSPSPPPCRFSITGPADVPGLATYQFQIALGGATATSISWTVDRPTATIEGPANQQTVTVAFANTNPDWITLRADFIANGQPQCAETQIALIQVTLGTPTLTTPGTSDEVSANLPMLVNPPANPPPVWVVTHVPGSDCAAFTYNGTAAADESVAGVFSSGGADAAFAASSLVTLTSPPQKPTAHQQIQIGYIQSCFESGSGTYAPAPPGKPRVVTTPTAVTVDWLVVPCNPGATDTWPWYDASAFVTGSGTGSFSTTIEMEDSPSTALPQDYLPGNSAATLSTGANTLNFTLYIAVRTTHTDLGADQFYFDAGQTSWVVNFVWPVTPGVSIVTPGPAAWTPPAAPSSLPVNVVPFATNHNAPFRRVIPQ